jgi:hypothetical protein
VLNVLRHVLDDPHVTDMAAAFDRHYALLQSAAGDTGAALDDILREKLAASRTPDRRLAGHNDFPKDPAP